LDDLEEEQTQFIEAFAPGAFFADTYRIESQLGGGASSQVYAATDLRNDARVALKVLRKERKQTREQLEEQRARFAREGEVLRTLVHPSIVRMYEIGAAADGTPFLAMEALTGETLSHRLAREKTLPLEVVLRVVAFAADAIDHAHALGVVHRDIKPENLFLPTTGPVPVSVLDFGLSRVIDVGARLTAVGATIGTPRYMAPEQILSARDASPAVDVYALGVCAYEALTGASPFDAADQAQLLGAILHGRRVPLRTRCPQLASAIEVVLDKAMAQRPTARHMSAVELAAALYRAARIEPDPDVPRAVARAVLDAPAVVERPAPVRDPNAPDPVAHARAGVIVRATDGEPPASRHGAYHEPPRFAGQGPATPPQGAPRSQPPNVVGWLLYGAGALALLTLGAAAAWFLFS
jgi:serine/threonine protein kinase